MLSLKDKRGMTLIELIVAISIMGIVVLLASSLNLFGWRSFNTSTSQANIQQEVRLVDQIMKDQVRNVSTITTESDSIAEPMKLKLDSNRLHYGEGQKLSLEGVENIAISTKESGKILVYEITTKNNTYNLKNEILLNNTTLDLTTEINLKDPGTALYYKR